MKQLSRLRVWVIRTYIEPHSLSVDSRRRETVLNILLTGLLVAATVALLFSSFNFFVWHLGDHPTTVIETLVFWWLIVILLAVSRRGQPQLAAVVLVILLLFSGLQYTLVWGFGLAIAELVLVLTIVVAGVLFTAPLALVAMAAVSVALIIVTILQTGGLQHPILYWQRQPYQPEDVVGYIVVFLIIGLVSWLSNRETDRSLRRARRSEAALQTERDNLEIKVIERTQQLEDIQLARLLELQPYVEFGRIGANLIHELTNPLTAVSLQLEELDRQQHSAMTRQMQRNLQQFDRYLSAARKQIKRQSEVCMFSVNGELRQVAHLITNRARRSGVKLNVDMTARLKLYGDPVKFNQMVANLLANAIDASENSPRKQVMMTVRQRGQSVVITITDYGTGIRAEDMEHLFEPFFSTKSSVHGGLGIGLALVKQYAEHDFRGSIAVTSTPSEGTVFELKLKGLRRS